MKLIEFFKKLFGFSETKKSCETKVKLEEVKMPEVKAEEVKMPEKKIEVIEEKKESIVQIEQKFVEVAEKKEETKRVTAKDIKLKSKAVKPVESEKIESSTEVKKKTNRRKPRPKKQVKKD